MGLFKRKPHTDVVDVEYAKVLLRGVRIENLLCTTGGGYENRPHPDHVQQMQATIGKHFKHFKYPEWWEGLGYLMPGMNGKHEVIWVAANGQIVDKLTKAMVDQLREIITLPTPVNVRVTIMSRGNPSVMVLPLK